MGLQDLFIHFSEQPPQKLQKEFGDYLIENETIIVGYKLVRDAVLFTDKRVLFFDKQGATGMKVKVESIFNFSIVNVVLNTAGFGVDESELEITYITNPYLASNHPNLLTKKLDFQKKVDIHSLYNRLETMAYQNCIAINQTPRL